MEAEFTMSQENQQQILETLRDIRDGQLDIIKLLSAQQAIAEEQIKKSRESVAESISLQRLALRRQRTVTVIAIPGILACITAIAYLVWMYL